MNCRLNGCNQSKNKLSVNSVFTWKEMSQGISVDSTNDGNDGQSKVTFVTLFFEGLIYKY